MLLAQITPDTLPLQLIRLLDTPDSALKFSQAQHPMSSRSYIALTRIMAVAEGESRTNHITRRRRARHAHGAAQQLGAICSQRCRRRTTPTSDAEIGLLSQWESRATIGSQKVAPSNLLTAKKGCPSIWKPRCVDLQAAVQPTKRAIELTSLKMLQEDHCQIGKMIKEARAVIDRPRQAGPQAITELRRRFNRAIKRPIFALTTEVA